MIISRASSIENDNVILDKDALETASKTIGLPTSILNRQTVQ